MLRVRRGYELCRRLASEIGAVRDIGGVPLALRFAVETLLNMPGVVRTQSLASVDEKFPLLTLRFRSRDLHFIGPEFGLLREIFGRRVYDREMAPPYGTVVDLGANYGFFTLYAICTGAEQVYAVDAQTEAVEVLQRNMLLNRLSERVEIECCAVGASAGALRQLVKDRKIPSFSLGALLLKWGVRHVDFLKVDIEGSEFEVFTSPDASEWLARTDRVGLEYHAEYGDPEQLAQILRRSGFSVLRRPTSPWNDRLGYILASRCEDLEKQKTIESAAGRSPVGPLRDFDESAPGRKRLHGVD
jgi:SAM-dependent methyltransferase